MVYILAAILIFGVLIGLHELGHFLAAKACGEMKQMTPEQIQQSIEVFKYYGQGTPTIPKDLVKRV